MENLSFDDTNLRESIGFPYRVYDGELASIVLGERLVINTINQYSFCVAERDSEFRVALARTDILLPDGIGIVKMLKWVFGKSVRKIAGEDVFFHLLRKLNESGGRCFFLGSSEQTLGKIKDRISLEFPNVIVGIYSPPYKEKFTEEDSNLMVEKVNEFEPDVLFVGMTAPKQEKWVDQFKFDLKVPIIASIGAVFDFYAGTVERPGRFWIDLGLEWFVRMIKEPRRMWKRYIIQGPVFLYHIAKLKKRIYQSSNNDNNGYSIDK